MPYTKPSDRRGEFVFVREYERNRFGKDEFVRCHNRKRPCK